MRAVALHEMQNIELSLLLAFDEVCSKHSLRYFMDGGTLLGALHYEGFIPWDDDIDIKMPRPDYDAFLKICGELPAHIETLAPSRSRCEYVMTKLMDNRTVLVEHSGEHERRIGVYIDIFPMDGYPGEGPAQAKHMRSMQRLNSLFHYSKDGFAALAASPSPVARIKAALYRRMYTPWGVYQRLTREAERYAYDESPYKGMTVEGDYMKERFERAWLDEAVPLEFEGHMLPAPCGYMAHLRRFYGEHITAKEYHHALPVIMPAHDYEVWWKDEED